MLNLKHLRRCFSNDKNFKFGTPSSKFEMKEVQPPSFTYWSLAGENSIVKR